MSIQKSCHLSILPCIPTENRVTVPVDDRQFILLSELINQYLRFDDFIKDSRVQKVSEGTDLCSMRDVFEAIRVTQTEHLLEGE